MLTTLGKSLWIRVKGKLPQMALKETYVHFPTCADHLSSILDQSNFLFIICKFISDTVFLVEACPTVSGVADTKISCRVRRTGYNFIQLGTVYKSFDGREEN